ncbi:unnamed protein product [Phytophthora fragariaefolia]|uniref:Unnamed protein product n=1 Tax=Phytophthora fragariaefolia TaxID=1490495 RepID=A0A9W7CRW5_9STRA|nr:unnamed protein product [Phytophthora fragariaefolia]
MSSTLIVFTRSKPKLMWSVSPDRLRLHCVAYTLILEPIHHHTHELGCPPPLATDAMLASTAPLDESAAPLRQIPGAAGAFVCDSGLAVTAARESAPAAAPSAGTARGGAAKLTASWNDEDVEELFCLRYKELDGRFKNTKDTKRTKFAWSMLASTLSVNQSKVFTDQQCQAKLQKDCCEGLGALGKRLAAAQGGGGDGLAEAAQQQIDVFQQQSKLANAQNTQPLLQIQAQSEQLKLHSDNIRERLDLIRRGAASR